ncbi:hypothetical protein B5566_22980 [Mycobacterium sp. MHSD3]|nr:hypothetical protein B5566_22980 [Mycobacterium sp. MHSD3]
MVIAWYLHRASTRLSGDSQRVTEDIRDHTHAIREHTQVNRKWMYQARRDATFNALQTVRDPQLLRRYLDEAWELAKDDPDVRIFAVRYYFGNPAVPLPEADDFESGSMYPHELHNDILSAAIVSLPRRFAGPRDAYGDVEMRHQLGGLLALCFRADQYVAGGTYSEASLVEQFFSYLRSIWLEGWPINVYVIGAYLKPWVPDVARRFLVMIEDHDLPKELFVSVLLAISWYIHDDVQKNVDDDDQSLLHAYTSLLHQGYLKDVGSWPYGADWENSTLQCVGSTAYAIGLLASSDEASESVAGHITRNLIEDLTRALESFDGIGLSDVRDGMFQLTNGIRLLKSKCADKSLIAPLERAANILLSRSHLGSYVR